MQLIKGAAVCGLTVAALVAGGSMAGSAAESTPASSGLATGGQTSGSMAGVLPASAPARAAPTGGIWAGHGPLGSAEHESAGSVLAGSRFAVSALAGDAAAGSSVEGPVAPGAAAGGGSAGAVPASSATMPRVASRTVDCRPMPPSRQRPLLDGFVVGWVPQGIGPMVTDFEYEWEDVGFRSRVWESGPYPDESYRVDLQVTVMRSPSFTDVAALREFLVGYLERDPAVWATEPFVHPAGLGFTDVGELFWLAEPGVAVRVFGGGEQLDFRDLTRTACAVRQVMPMD